MIKMQSFFRDSDQHIGRYGNPYLRLDGVLAGAEKHLDAQVLLDPFEEQFHLPALAEENGVRERFPIFDILLGTSLSMSGFPA